MTQQSAATVIDREFAAYWIPRIREVRRAGWSDLRPKSVDAREQSKMKSGRLKPGAGCAGYRGKGSGEHESSGERGRRRTRQDQISLRALAPVKLRTLGRSAPNEENSFLLPDRFEGANSYERRSSRLT